MSAVHVIAIIKPAEGKKDAVEAGFKEMAAKVQEAEPGVEVYSIFWDEQNGEFVFFEKYKDQAALDAHKNGSLMKEAMEKGKLEDLTAAPPQFRAMTAIGGFAR